MATVDVAPLVSPVYTPTLLVPTDGSTLTQALLTNLIVSLGNRTEFLRDLSAEASDTPEAFCTVREDFLGVLWTPSQSLLQGTVQWRTTPDDGFISVSGNAGASKNPGLLNVSLPGDGDFHVFAAYFENASGEPFSFLKFQTMTVVVKKTHDAANVTDRIHFGLCDDADIQGGGNDALMIQHLGANAKWQFVRVVGGVTTTTTLTGADFVSGEYAVWRMNRVSGGSDSIEVYLNDVLVHTVATVDMPGGSCNFSLYQEVTAADTESLQVSWDFVSLRTKPTDRSGV